MDTEQLEAKVIEVEKQIAVFDADSRQRWVSHDRAAEERSKVIREGFEAINRQLNDLQASIRKIEQRCATRPSDCLECIEKKILGRVRFYITVALGVPTTVAAIFAIAKFIQ